MIDRIDLSGNWSFFPDEEEKLSAPPEHFPNEILIPAVSSGCIWIQKEITIPPELQGKKMELFLERTVSTKLWVNQNYLASYFNAYAPHSYDISEYSSQEKICILLCIKPPFTYLAGEISLRFYDKNHIRNVKVSVDCQKHQAVLNFLTGGSFQKISVKGEWFDRNGTIALIPTQMLEIQQIDKHHASGLFQFKEKFLLWDVHHPVMCKLSFTPEQSEDSIEISFGITDSNIALPFLRGAICPLLSPLASEKEWFTFLKIVKSYGINLLSFYDGCPPEIAFQIADLLGIFIELRFCPELSWSEMKQTFSAFVYHPSFRNFLSVELCEMTAYQTYPASEDFPVLERLEKVGMADLAEEFKICSGQYVIQLYKKEIESVMRSEGSCGFLGLPLQDGIQEKPFSGILNSCLDSKKMISKKDWTGFCSDSVLLGEFSDDILTDSLHMRILFRHHSPVPVNASMEYVIERGSAILAEGEFPINIQNQGLFELGRVDLPLKSASHIHKIKITLSLPHTENFYRLWQFPVIPMPELESSENLCITSNKIEMLFMLKRGKHVLYLPKHLKNSIKGSYLPSEMLGLVIHKHHQALGEFRCERWFTPQWIEIVNHAECAVLDDLNLQPIVQVIDNFKSNHKLGILFECIAGKGKLLVCTSRLDEISQRPETAQFAKSIIDYASSEAFCPKDTLTFQQIETIL